MCSSVFNLINIVTWVTECITPMKFAICNMLHPIETELLLTVHAWGILMISSFYSGIIFAISVSSEFSKKF